MLNHQNKQQFAAPVRNMRMSPGRSSSWILDAVSTAART